MSRGLREGGLEFILSLAVALVALAAGLLFIVASGVPAGTAATAFVDGAVGTDLNVAGTLSKTVPLALVAIAWIVAFRAGRFHVGFPGQIIIGALLVSVVALKLSLPAGLHLPVAVLAGAIGGALYAVPVAWLWARRGVNEILTTLLLNLIAVEVIAWWVREPFHDPTTTLPLTPPFADAAQWPELMVNTQLHWDIVLVPVLVIALAFVLNRSTFGFRVRVVGAHPNVARHAAISPHRVGSQAIVLSGALAGLAGSSLVLAATTPAMGDELNAEYGYTGIAVALLARNSPWATIPAALLFAALLQAGATMEGTVGISTSLVDILEGLIIINVLAATTLLYAYRRRRKTPSPGRPTTARPQPTSTHEVPA